MRNPLAALLLALPLAVSAQDHACKPLANIGCWYAPAGAGRSMPLLVYLRGHHPVHGRGVPAHLWLDSSRQAFDFYGLGTAAVENRSAVLVTYRSDLAVDQGVIDRLALESGLTFSRRVVAAHSGGYVALGKTLDNGMPFDAAVLLDLFYSGSPKLAQDVQARFAGRCRGFYTPHAPVQGNYENVFRPNAPGCPIDAMPAGTHNSAVNHCLAVYARGERCEPPPAAPPRRRP
jgi:hypothetical protein